MPTQEQLTDGEAAYGWVTGYLPEVADARGWTDDELADALADTDAAYGEADDVGSGWFGYGVDAETFYNELSDHAATWTGDGAAELVQMFDTGAYTADEVERLADEADLPSQVAGAAEQTGEDLAGYAAATKSVIESKRTWAGVALAGAAALLAWVL